MEASAFVLGGFVIGLILGVLVTVLWRRREAAVAKQLFEESQAQRSAEVSLAVADLKTAFAVLSKEALSSNTDDFLKLAKSRLEQQAQQGGQVLDAKKQLIDGRLQEMDAKLVTLNKLVQELEKQRAESFGSVANQLARTTEVTNRLHDTTSKLQEALSHPQRRGQWGERMAEDVLRLAGFVEGVNYVKQKRASEGTFPDFTFMLPDQRKVHMDVKFPLANYLKMLEATEGAVQVGHAQQFLKDVRSRIREVTGRSYIDASQGTIDFVLVFIPNEQVYGFIHERDPGLLDDAMRMRVILCSPLSLYAILAVIRESVDRFRLERSSDRILTLLGEFQKQWHRYVETMERMGRKLEEAGKEYRELTGVRTRQLDLQLDKVEQIRATRAESATETTQHELDSTVVQP